MATSSPSKTLSSVKELGDSGLRKIPKMFVWPSEHHPTPSHQVLQAPIIDLSGDRNKIVEQVGFASGTWGIFQVVNHGIPQSVLDGMIEGLRKFNEQDEAEKYKYSNNQTTKVKFHGGFEVLPSAPAASWRDTFEILSVSEPDPYPYKEQIPPICRDSTLEYSKHVHNLGNMIFGLLSEALGLETDRLKNMEGGKDREFHCHYYPACPEPEVTVGVVEHTDGGFLTILLQNQINGLQVLYEGHWVDIRPIPGALVVNIGDLLQVVSNGKLKSVVHRGNVSRIGPRISAGYFFNGPVTTVSETNDIYYGPIQELISEENPPIYREVPFTEHKNMAAIEPDRYCALNYYKV